MDPRVAVYETAFRKKVDAALERTRALLEDSIRPVRPDSVTHAYDDKFQVANSVNSLALESIWAIVKKEIVLDAQDKTLLNACLLFESSETCQFVSEEQRQQKGGKTTITSEVSGRLCGTKKETTSIEKVDTITEYVWTHTFAYKLSLVERTNRTIIKELRANTCSLTLRSVSKEQPPKHNKINQPIVLDLKILELVTTIDREDPACKTPRRNPQVEACKEAFNRLATTAHAIDRLLPWDHKYKQRTAFADRVFSPPTCVGLSESELKPFSPFHREQLVAEMCRTFDEQAVIAAKSVPEKSILGPDETRFGLALCLLQTLSNDYTSAVGYLEDMLFSQLSEAIGKNISADAFAEYMIFHDRLLLAPEFRPTQFAYSIRRTADSFPDGELRLEDSNSGAVAYTTCRHIVDAGPRMFFTNGAAKFCFEGDRYAHAYIARTFAAQMPTPLRLVSRARQFSSFLLMVGTIVGPEEFKADHAIIIKNKDEVVLPLLLEPMPTPKQFSDAIESLSPEQQAFCKAFRAMQLASTLFAILIVQLKPQVEAVLNLDPGALTKHIALTESLMDLFIEYQIPTSMLSYDGPENASLADKVSAVKTHVDQIQKILADARDKELHKSAQDALHRKLEHTQLEDNDEFTVEAAAREEATVQRRLAPNVFPKVADRAASISMQNQILLASSTPPSPEMAVQAMAFGGTVRMQEAAPAVLTQQSSPQTEEPHHVVADLEWDRVETGYDLAALPRQLDSKFKALDTDSQLRPTILKSVTPWTKRSKKSILAEATVESLDTDALARERARAFDLLDALTRGGALGLASTALHVMVCATHAFDKSITDTLVVDNVDPILKAERASLILASTLYDRPPTELVAPDRLRQASLNSPHLLQIGESEEAENLGN